MHVVVTNLGVSAAPNPKPFQSEGWGNLPCVQAVEEVEALAAVSPEESMFVEEVVPETAGRANVTSEQQEVAAEEPETANENDVPAFEQLDMGGLSAAAEPLAAAGDQPVSIAAPAAGAKEEEPEPTTFKPEACSAVQAEEPTAVKAEEPAAVKVEESAAEEAGKPEVPPVSHRYLSYTSNGSSFQTFGKATVRLRRMLKRRGCPQVQTGAQEPWLRRPLSWAKAVLLSPFQTTRKKTWQR